MEGLKAAIEFITELKESSMEPKVLEINGNTYCNKNLTRYHYFPKADSLSVNTLTSIVDYIKGKPEELRETMILHVISPTEVRLYAVWNKDVTDKDERLDDGSTDIDSLDAFEYTIERDMKDLIEEVEDV